MTPLGKIEAGITDANWQLVCDGFNKLTGKKLEPPQQITMTLKATFDPQKATKKELYNWLLDYAPLEPMKNYTVADLKEMVGVYQLTEKAEPVVKKDNGYISPDLRGGPLTQVK